MAAEAVFGCGNITDLSAYHAQESISKAYGINFYEPYKKNPEYQPLSAPINIKGISFDRVLFPNNLSGYTLKVASIADLKLLETAFHMRKQKPYRKNYDSIYVNLDAEGSYRQASVNYKNLTFTCRWRTEDTVDFEPD